MLRFENHVGRLLELRADSPLTVEQMHQGVKDITAILSMHTRPMVCCADFRKLGIMSKEVTEIIVATMRSDNPKIERSAYLIPSASATAGLQWERLVREGLNPVRRLYRDDDYAGLLAYLDEALDAAERTRMRSFYDENMRVSA
ncbi:MAG: hypothetical protein AB2A00_02865 [Myxococcota bacterium]